jgi:D-amino peptidase
MRFYISADIEGIVGVVSREHTSPQGFEYERARDWMSDTVAAACEAAYAAGASEIVISDSHGSGQNIKLERLPQTVQLVRSGPRPLAMMQGIEFGTYEGAMFLGYHSGSTASAGILGHTMRSVALREVRLNGRVLNEAGVNAAIAGHFGVPIIMISGDDAFVAETREILGDVEAATVKWVHSLLSARTLMPQAAYALVREAVTRAIERRRQFEPFVMPGPIELQVSFKHRLPVDYLEFCKFIERVDAFTVRYRGADMVEISRFLVFMLGYSSSVI